MLGPNAVAVPVAYEDRDAFLSFVFALGVARAFRVLAHVAGMPGHGVRGRVGQGRPELRFLDSGSFQGRCSLDEVLLIFESDEDVLNSVLPGLGHRAFALRGSLETLGPLVVDLDLVVFDPGGNPFSDDHRLPGLVLRRPAND